MRMLRTIQTRIDSTLDVRVATGEGDALALVVTALGRYALDGQALTVEVGTTDHPAWTTTVRLPAQTEWFEREENARFEHWLGLHPEAEAEPADGPEMEEDEVLAVFAAG